LTRYPFNTFTASTRVARNAGTHAATPVTARSRTAAIGEQVMGSGCQAVNREFTIHCLTPILPT
jgi:hypothetical protein